MKTRIAFVGLRHSHIFALLNAAQAHPDVEVVAICEEDSTTREQLAASGQAKVTHGCYDSMLAEVETDVIATGDYYSKRGAILIKALKAGKHIISDKPICTSLAELNEIEALARANNLQIGCQLDLRDNGALIGLRDVLLSGAIGEPVTVNITAQHPLNLGVRPGWYFVPGQHGGTINDIGIHAFDIVPWLTGQPITEVVGAREWNCRAVDFPHFKDCAQVLLKLGNNGGVLADFSYLAPTKLGFQEPSYWQFIVHGTKGTASARYNAKEIRVVTDEDEAPRLVPAPADATNRYFQDFLDNIVGNTEKANLTTAVVLRSSRTALEAQAQAAAKA